MKEDPNLNMNRKNYKIRPISPLIKYSENQLKN